MLSLLFFTWSLAALSAHFLDVYFIVSLVPMLSFRLRLPALEHTTTRA